MRLDQTAYYCATDEQALFVKKLFGLENAEWIKDTVVARSKVWDFQEQTNMAELQFNYSLGGHELEILRYVQGPHWHDPAQLLGIQYKVPFISHTGFHLDDNEDFPAMEGCRLVQETWTVSHTSEYLTKPGSPGFGRKYHYRIFELSHGSYIKYIKRIPAVK